MNQEEHEQEIHDLTLKYANIEKTLTKKVKSQENKIKDLKQRLEASRHESEMLKLQVEKEKKQRHQNNMASLYDTNTNTNTMNNKPKEINTALAASTTTASLDAAAVATPAKTPVTAIVNATPTTTTADNETNRPIRSVHRRQNSSFTIERNEKGNSSVIVVKRTTDEEFFNENYEYDEYITNDGKDSSSNGVKSHRSHPPHSQQQQQQQQHHDNGWHGSDDEKDRDIDHIRKQDPNSNLHLNSNHQHYDQSGDELDDLDDGNTAVVDLERKYHEIIESLRVRNQNLEKELSNLQKQTDKEIKKLNEKIQELRSENDHTSEKFIGDKQRLLHAINQKETTIKKLETEMEKMRQTFQLQLDAKTQQIKFLEADINLKKDELIGLGDLVDTLQKELEQFKLYDEDGTPIDESRGQSGMDNKRNKGTRAEHEIDRDPSQDPEDDMDPSQATLEHQGSFLGNGVVDANIGIVFVGEDGEQDIDSRDNLIPESEDYDGSELDAAIGYTYTMDMENNDPNAIESYPINNNRENGIEPTQDSEENVELLKQYEQLKSREEELRRELAEKARLLTESKKELDAMKNIESAHVKTITELTDLINGLKITENISDVNSDDLNSEEIKHEIEQAEEKLILKKTQSQDNLNIKNSNGLDEIINSSPSNVNHFDNNTNTNTNTNTNNNNNDNHNHINTNTHDSQDQDQNQNQNKNKNKNNHLGIVESITVPDGNEPTRKLNPVEKSPATHVLDYMYQGVPLRLQTPISEEQEPDFATPKDPPSENTVEDSLLKLLDGSTITPGGPDELISASEKGDDGAISKISTAYEQRIKLMQGMLEAEKKKNKDLSQNLEDKNNKLDQMRDEKNTKIHTLFEELKKMKDENDKHKDAINAYSEEIRSLHTKIDRQGAELKTLEQDKITSLLGLAQELDKMRALLKTYKRREKKKKKKGKKKKCLYFIW